MGEALERARARSREAHQRLERRLDLTRGLSRERYARYLSRLAPLIAEADALLARSGLDDASMRTKSIALREDLAALGATASTSARGLLPDATTTASLFGVLYVIEGSTLGGSVLAREVERQLGDAPAAYFRCYGDRIGPRWRAFYEALDERGAREPDAVADAAAATFEAFEAWLDEGGLLGPA